MYCSKCGVENSDMADYCKGCGSALRSSDEWGRDFGPPSEGSPIFGILFALFVCAMAFSGFSRIIGFPWEFPWGFPWDFPWGFPWGFPWIPRFMLTPILIIGLIFLAIFMYRR